MFLSDSDSDSDGDIVQQWQVQNFINGCNTPRITAVCIRSRTSKPGPSEEELLANSNVETKTVSAEPLEIGPIRQEDGLGTRSKSGTP
jgi:hypothetical protein